MINEGNQLSSRLEVDELSYDHLVETAKWSKFLAIVGFVLSCLIVVIALFAGTFMSMFIPNAEGAAAGAFMVSVVYILIAALYFFTSLYLFKFGVKMQNALGSNDQELFNAALNNQRIFYRIIGVIMIIYLAIMVLAVVVVLLALGSNMN